MKFRPVFSAFAVAAIAALAIAGCGSSSTKTSTSSPASGANTAQSTGATKATGSTAAAGTATSVIKISADPTGQLMFKPSALTVAAGKHKVVFVNNSPLTHDLIFGKGYSEGGQVGEVKKISKGSVSTTIDFKKGKYDFYCDVKGHREAGMKGVLTVQ